MKTLQERFMSHVEQSEDGCWRWTAYCMKNGYGLFRMADRHHLAHRIAHELFNGPLVDGLDVMHACDNRCCVNPAHLSLGTRKQNMTDAVDRGRLARGARHGRSRLTEPQAVEILRASGPHDPIARRFGVSTATVSDIKRGARWSHLQHTA